MPLTLVVLMYLMSLTYPGPAVNGVKIVTRQVTGGFTDTRTEYLTANRFRNEWETRTSDHSGPMASIVQRGDRDRVFVLDLRAKEYVTYETDSRGTALGTKAAASGNSGGTLQIWIENIDTGERKEIFGHNARHIITREKRVATPGACSTGSESETDGWYIDNSVMPEWRQPKKNSLGKVVVASVVAVGSRNDCQNKMDKIEVHQTGTEAGFPVKSMTTLKSVVTERDGTPRMLASIWGSEVVELHEGPLDPALFDVPADFRQVASLKSWSTPTPRRQLTGWEWFKDRVQEIFR